MSYPNVFRQITKLTKDKTSIHIYSRPNFINNLPDDKIYKYKIPSKIY